VGFTEYLSIPMLLRAIAWFGILYPCSNLWAFRSNVLLTSSWSKNKPSKHQAETACLSYSTALTMEGVHFYETSLNFNHITHRHCLEEVHFTVAISRTRNVICRVQQLYRFTCILTITNLDVIHRPVFHLKHDVSETAFSLSIFRRNLPSWAQYIQLISVSGSFVY
jgi:hypothetical protein